MLSQYKTEIEKHLRTTLSAAYGDIKEWPPIELEVPADKKHGHFSCNIAMRSAKTFRKPPVAIAEEFSRAISDSLPESALQDVIAKVEVKNPGFINFFLKTGSLVAVLERVYGDRERYGSLSVGAGKKICIEFVSANPTGPLSIAHARQAAVGDALGNILNFIGFDVTKEYYVNDGGNQINILGQSIRHRALEILGEDVEFPEEGYQGDYIRDMAVLFMEREGIDSLATLKAAAPERFKEFGVEHLMAMIRKDLSDFHVSFDVWSHESVVAGPDMIEGMLAYLGEK